MRRPVMAFALSLALAASVAAQPAYIFFGDSLSDDGNAFEFTGGLIPPSPPNFNGRFSNGPVWNELMPALVGGTFVSDNVYAFSGAQSGSIGLPPGLLVQMNSYLAQPGDPAPGDVHVIWIGGNDYLNANSPVAPVIGNITSAISTLAAAGADRFVILNLPDIGQTPRAVNSGTSAALRLRTIEHNEALAVQMPALATSLAVRITVVDIFALQEAMIADPGAFGLTNVTAPCLVGSTPCATPDTYHYWDEIHPTAVVHEVVAAYVAASIQEPSAASTTWMIY